MCTAASKRLLITAFAAVALANARAAVPQPPSPFPPPVPATLTVEGSLAAASSAPTEYEVKAAFLYHFAQFTEWPPEALGDSGPFVVAVLGRDPFGALLDETLAGKMLLGRPIQIRRIGRPEEASDAHLVFVCASQGPDPRPVLKRLAREGVLTVGETDGFARQGGIIGFRVEGRRVRFVINPRRAELAHLKMSSQLLKLATIVEE